VDAISIRRWVVADGDAAAVRLGRTSADADVVFLDAACGRAGGLDSHAPADGAGAGHAGPTRRRDGQPNLVWQKSTDATAR
jgi:hypothetical protein